MDPSAQVSTQEAGKGLETEFEELLQRRYPAEKPGVRNPALSERARRLVEIAESLDGQRAASLLRRLEAKRTVTAERFGHLDTSTQTRIVNALMVKSKSWRGIDDRGTAAPRGEREYRVEFEVKPSVVGTITKSSEYFRDNYVDFNIQNFAATVDQEAGTVVSFVIEYRGGRRLSLDTSRDPFFRIPPRANLGEPLSAEEVARSLPPSVTERSPSLRGVTGIVVRAQFDVVDYYWVRRNGLIFPVSDGEIRWARDTTPTVIDAIEDLILRAAELRRLQTLKYTAGAFGQIIGMNAAVLGGPPQWQSMRRPTKPEAPKEAPVVPRTPSKTTPTRATTTTAPSTGSRRRPPAPTPIRTMFGRFGKVGKFAKGGGERVRIHHGTSPEHLQTIEASGIDVRFKEGEPRDFGPGFYATTDPRVADAGAARKGQGMRVILTFEISANQMGDVVDIRRGGVHEKQWKRFLGAKLVESRPETNGYVFETQADARPQLFTKFLKENGLEGADVVIGPIGDPQTTGAAAVPGVVSDQICIRSPRIARILNAQIRGAAPPRRE